MIKGLLIAMGVVALVVAVLIGFVLFRIGGAIGDAQGRAIYSGIGAWTRIAEFAHEEGKSAYIAEAEEKLAFLQGQLKSWQAGVPTGTDSTALEQARDTTYTTTDQNIRNGENPLAYLDTPPTLPDPRAGS